MLQTTSMSEVFNKEVCVFLADHSVPPQHHQVLHALAHRRSAFDAAARTGPLRLQILKQQLI